MYVLFYVYEVIGVVDWHDKGLIYEKSYEMCMCLWPEFDCPEVTLCGCQDVKIQLTNLIDSLILTLEKLGPECSNQLCSE